MTSSASIGLYVHVPFCRTRCPYCTFGVELRQSADHDEYVAALLLELDRRAPPGSLFSSILIGGGTPTELEPSALAALLTGISRAIDRAPDAEWNVEANPETLDDATLDALEQGGVTRLTIGCQSFQDNDLRTLGRGHTANEAAEAVTRARRRGFRSIGIDLLARIAGQTDGSFTGNIHSAVDLGADHVALYALSPGEPAAAEDISTTWAQRRAQASDALAGHGLLPYELTAFARPGHEERHRIDRCRGLRYLGVGPYAASYLADERTVNVTSVARYLCAVRAGKGLVADRERLPPAAALRERLMLGLHLRAGIDWRPDDPSLTRLEREALGTRIAELVRAGALICDAETIRLSAAGWDDADTVFGEILDL